MQLDEEDKKRCLELTLPFEFSVSQQDTLDESEPYEGETITHSAVRTPTNAVYAGKAPARHHNCIAYMALRGLTDEPGSGLLRQQGFLTSRGRYVSRALGLAVAQKADQLNKVRPKTFPLNLLYSEDVWKS